MQLLLDHLPATRPTPRTSAHASTGQRGRVGPESGVARTGTASPTPSSRANASREPRFMSKASRAVSVVEAFATLATAVFFACGLLAVLFA